jgi:glycosyltransferase involved in cell wall biosynthesis
LTDAHAGGVRIGVVIPAFNVARWVGDAVASVLAQTHAYWSLVVVDDGSTDDTSTVVARFCDPRIRLIRQDNAGVSAARNRGMTEFLGWGRGSGMLFLDADDWLAPDALSRLGAALDASPDTVAASGPCEFVQTGAVRIPPSGELLPRLLVRNLFVNGGHLLLRTEAVHAAGGFLSGIAYGEDWEFWVRLALRGPFAAVLGTAPVLFVRVRTGAYWRLAQDPDAFTPCMEAIFGNPALLARFGAEPLAAIRLRTEAENEWIVGREQIRHGRGASGLARLRRSVRRHVTLRRAMLLATAHASPLLPAAWRGPFRPYPRGDLVEPEYVGRGPRM